MESWVWKQLTVALRGRDGLRCSPRWNARNAAALLSSSASCAGLGSSRLCAGGRQGCCQAYGRSSTCRRLLRSNTHTVASRRFISFADARHGQLAGNGRDGQTDLAADASKACEWVQDALQVKRCTVTSTPSIIRGLGFGRAWEGRPEARRG